uniref:Ig-like domain-containing protein n=1 Tax=Salmo trutta TaxID=8032 RepID=A0A674BFJ0_SALTR
MGLERRTTILRSSTSWLNLSQVLKFRFITYFSSAGMVCGDSVTPDKEEYTPTEGSSVSLSWTYETSSSISYLYWYQQYPNHAPEYLLFNLTFGAGETATEFKERFHARLNVTAKSVPLTIQRVQLSDSAVYYCALRPTVTTGYTATLQKLYVSCVHRNIQ